MTVTSLPSGNGSSGGKVDRTGVRQSLYGLGFFCFYGVEISQSEECLMQLEGRPEAFCVGWECLCMPLHLIGHLGIMSVDTSVQFSCLKFYAYTSWAIMSAAPGCLHMAISGEH